MEMRMEMKASLCVGEYCETAYNIEELEIRVYCMEELCYCLKENAFLLDMSIMNDKLVDWIGEECRVRELAKQLYPMVHKQGSLSAFVLTILQYVGIYGEEELQAVAQVLKQGSGLSNLEKRKSQIDYMVEKRKYAAAIRGYDMLLETWSDLEREGRELPAGKVRAAILHNKGVTLTGRMLILRQNAWSLQKMLMWHLRPEIRNSIQNLWNWRKVWNNSGENGNSSRNSGS